MATDGDEPDYESILPGKEGSDEKLMREFMRTNLEHMKRVERGELSTLSQQFHSWATGTMTLISPLVAHLLGEKLGLSAECREKAEWVLRWMLERNVLGQYDQAKAAEEKMAAAKGGVRGETP